MKSPTSIPLTTCSRSPSIDPIPTKLIARPGSMPPSSCQQKNMTQREELSLPSTKAVLEVLDSAEAAQPASCHDADAAAQGLTLLHAM